MLKPNYSSLSFMIAGEEGITALYNGLTAGLQRQVVFAGLRIGLYVPVRTLIAGELKPGENPSLATKILAAMATGITYIIL
jgi:solute carrier family 25 (mitochondrial uncoupling protein), member 8/9